ncbi:Glycosyl hydrolases family 16 [Abditibacterium utsteinense]|uniref:Glycosyl hydrolases family 16 n=1 Tax=Abditibacterium utsteinense TaxID=1960156 RepID=A0A2S8SQX4_9BACT|nr:PA14 domain-containing protein [Abditibacterium utsteinense]PQV63211.1 Glycosyl hydrolases family 16 [Abditibacterium utsteinense]
MRLSPLFSRSISRFTLPLMAAGALVAGTTHAARAQQLFGDEFSGSFNANGAWNTYLPWQNLGRTQFGLSPSIASENGVSFARLPMRTYNDAYNASNPMLQSTEIFSKNTYQVGTGIEFEARLRGFNVPRGAVFGLYAYNEKGVWPNGYLKEEIDFEVLSNMAKNQFWSNIWNDWNGRYAYNDGIHNQDQIVTVGNMNYTAWTTYTARWYPDRVEWYVNGTLARTSKTIVPDDPLSVHFNIWAPDSGWAPAYDAAMQPTGNISKNVTCSLDVDYVRVRRLPLPLKGIWGDGDGLAATLYPQPNFAGTPVKRVDPRLNHDWKTFSPDTSIPNDNFSAKWTGTIASPFSENVTLTLRADDGVRLYLDNKLLINDWRITAPTERSVTVAMKANVKVPIRVEYFEGTGGASAQLLWQSASMPKGIVPQSQLFSNLDNTAPTLTLAAPGPNYSYRSLSATGTATDADSGVARVFATLKRASDGLYWNGSAWGSAQASLGATLSGANWTLPLGTLGDGRYTITVSALDKAGNSASLPARDFWFDNAAPTTAITTPANGASYATLSAASGNASDIGTGVASVSTAFLRSSDGLWWTGSAWSANYSEVKATFDGTNWKLAMPALSGGAYIFWAQSYDYAGNIGAWTRSDFTLSSSATTSARTSASATATPKPTVKTSSARAS